jgi:hypothetical protein
MGILREEIPKINQRFDDVDNSLNRLHYKESSTGTEKKKYLGQIP